MEGGRARIGKRRSVVVVGGGGGGCSICCCGELSSVLEWLFMVLILPPSLMFCDGDTHAPCHPKNARS